MRSRAAFLTGLLASPLAAAPAALRCQPGLVGQALVVLTAGSALVMAPLAAALAVAEAPGKFTRAVTVGALIAALPLLPVATLLKTATHHRPLGGATFAVIAGLTIVGLALVSSRLITWAGEQRSALRSSARLAVVGLAALGAAAVVLGLVHGLEAGPAYRVGFFDALRVLGFATLAARAPVPLDLLRRLRGFGLAAWIAVVTVGVCLGHAPVMQTELAARSPVLHWPLLWLGG